jgi:ABC-type uncharacterized transport system permease subunit
VTLRLQRISAVSSTIAISAKIGGIVMALGLGALALMLTGVDVGSVVAKVGSETFGSGFGAQDLGLLWSPLILTGLSVWIGRRVASWNIGAEGQFYAGALAATGLGAFVNGPPALMLVAMFIAGALGGAAWIALPAFAKAYAQVNEVITTLLLNFVAILLVNYLCTGPWRDREAAVISASRAIPYEVPPIWGDLHAGFLVAVASVLAAAVLFRFTRFGFEVRLTGANPSAAKYAGVSVRKRQIETLLLSGAVAGVAGMLEVAGSVHRLQGGIANNFGYLGILVAVLAGSSIFGILASALLMALLLNSGIIMQTDGLSTHEVLALTGLILLLTAIGERLMHYRIVAPKRIAESQEGAAL